MIDKIEMLQWMSVREREKEAEMDDKGMKNRSKGRKIDEKEK